MKWVTRKNIQTGRIASAWLIRRFIDADAEFFFVEETKVLATASREEAVPFDLPGHADLKFNAQQGLSTFEVLQREFEIDDRALYRLAGIVRTAKSGGEEKAFLQAPGLRAIADGFALLDDSDEQRLIWGFPVFDALHAWCREHSDES